MRLIDADALTIDMVIEEAETPLMPWYSSHMSMRKTDGVSIEQINNSPTIDAVPHWIPCEERLPEPTQEVLVTGISGCVYTSRIVHGEFEYGGNVIAWMPLPKPYKGERRDDEID